MNNICTRKMIVKEVVGMFYSSHRMEPCYCTAGNCTNLSREPDIKMRCYQRKRRKVLHSKSQILFSHRSQHAELLNKWRKISPWGEDLRESAAGRSSFLIILNLNFLMESAVARSFFLLFCRLFSDLFLNGKVQRGDHHSSFLLNLIEILAHPLGKLTRNQPLE